MLYFSNGALQSGSPFGGIAEFEHNPIETLGTAFQKCCPSDPKYQRLCRFYYDMSPSNNCSGYTASDEG